MPRTSGSAARVSSRMRRYAAPLVVAVLVLMTYGLSAQRYRLPEGFAVPPRFFEKESYDGAFTICKVAFRSVTREANGMGWATDWPYAGINLMTRLSELTKTSISRDREGDPNHWVVRLTDDALFRCPVITASDVGTIELSEPERQRLREYLLKGGFFWADDFWGPAAWERWSLQIARVFPEFPIVDLPLDHPMFRTMYQIREIPQVASINFWARSGGRTDERGHASPAAVARGLADSDGRVMIFMTFNTDISDSWEREGENSEFFTRFSPPGYSLGVDVMLYALTH